MIELRINIPAAELRTLYQEASIFWHLCGIIHDHPSEVEHFGMTTVEAMQSGAVPVVYDGGGLREIIDHGAEGFRVKTKAELLECTMKLIRQPEIMEKLGASAHEKAQQFSRARFEERVRTFFRRILEDYSRL
jgi:glycosyltransferase involved in cell wall biosynthesis